MQHPETSKAVWFHAHPVVDKHANKVDKLRWGSRPKSRHAPKVAKWHLQSRNSYGKCILPKNIILVQNHHKNKRHAPKTKLFTSSTKFGCSSTILHHFQSWSQPKYCWHQKWAARPNSYWVIAHVHHMHRSVYFHTPFCYELPVRQLPSSEAQSSHVACKYVSSHPPTIVRISTKSSLHVGCRCFQITYVR